VSRRRLTLRIAALMASLAAAHLAPAAIAAPDAIGVQGRWAYARQTGPDETIDMATTPAVQDSDIWLLLACNESARMSVAVMHVDRFPFALDDAAPVQLQSAKLARISAATERARPAQITIDPTLMRHIMPLLVDEQELAIAMTASDGTVHSYTFVLQPNDVALAPLRSRCLGRG